MNVRRAALGAFALMAAALLVARHVGRITHGTSWAALFVLSLWLNWRLILA